MSQSKKPFDLASFFRRKIRSAEDAGLPRPWNEPDNDVWAGIESSLPEPGPNRLRFFPWIIGIALLGLIGWLLTQNMALKEEIALLETKTEKTAESRNTGPAGTGKMAGVPNEIQGLTSERIGEEASMEEKAGNPAASVKVREKNALFTEKSVDNIQGEQAIYQSSARNVTPSSPGPDQNSPVGEREVLQVTNDESGQAPVQLDISHRSGLSRKEPAIVQPLNPVDYKLPISARAIPLITGLPQKRYPSGTAIDRVSDQHSDWQLSFAYEPTFARLQNTIPYPQAPEFRGIDDLGVWSDAFSLKLTRSFSGVDVFAGVRYGNYQYQTAYYIALPYDPLLETEGSDGNFTSDFNHSFPSPVGDVEAKFGLLRLAEDDIPAQAILDVDMHARHRMRMIEVPLGVSKSVRLSKRFSLTGSLSAIPGFVLSKESYAHAFLSHNAAMHHRYSGFRDKTKSYNHLILSGGAGASVEFRLTPQLGLFAGAGYQFGFTNIYRDSQVHSKIRAFRMSIGVTNRLFR